MFSFSFRLAVNTYSTDNVKNKAIESYNTIFKKTYSLLKDFLKIACNTEAKTEIKMALVRRSMKSEVSIFEPRLL